MADQDDAALALDVLRTLVDQEVARSERSATRARQIFALAAGFFAVVQTVAFSHFASGLVSKHERAWVLGLAGVSGFFLAVCGVALLFADRNWRTKHLTSDNVIDAVNDAREDPNRPVVDRLAGLYAKALDEMRSANEDRARLVSWEMAAGISSVIVALGELTYALFSRLS